MRYPLEVFLAVALTIAAASFAGLDPVQAGPQARPRTSAEPQRGGGEPQAAPREPQRAQPRPPDNPPPRTEPDRRTPAPPRGVPPQYHRMPRRYSFPLVSVQRGFYYHPYFGFYYGPYYGPYYPYPGPFFGPATYSAVAVRTRVRPTDTHVYVNGYFAGHVDDFDGIFQRLYLPAGQHEVAFQLDGYETHVERVYLSPGDTREIAHQMVQLPAGRQSILPQPPRSLPDGWTIGPAPVAGGLAVSPYGILAIRVQPEDALVFIDGEPWLNTESAAELVIHVPAGRHTLEVRKDGYQTFRTDITPAEGMTTRLNVQLAR
jgi:hypothetical protein